MTIELAVGAIHADEAPPADLDHLEETIASVRRIGLAQPVSVTADGQGGYRLILGRRRFAAALLAGATTIPAHVLGPDHARRLEALIAQLSDLGDLPPSQLAGRYDALVRQEGLTVEDLADLTGNRKQHVADHLALLDLPDAARQAVDDATLPVDLAAHLSALTPHHQLSVLSRWAGGQYASSAAFVADVGRLREGAPLHPLPAHVNTYRLANARRTVLVIDRLQRSLLSVHDLEAVVAGGDTARLEETLADVEATAGRLRASLARIRATTSP